MWLVCVDVEFLYCGDGVDGVVFVVVWGVLIFVEDFFDVVFDCVVEEFFVDLGCCEVVVFVFFVVGNF